jgi:hypothetical protein
VAVRRRRWQDTDLVIVGDEAHRFAGVVQTFAGEAAAPPAAVPIVTPVAQESGRKSH